MVVLFYLFSPILCGSLLPDYEVSAALAFVRVLVARSNKRFVTLNLDFYVGVIAYMFCHTSGGVFAGLVSLAYKYEKFVRKVIFKVPECLGIEFFQILHAVNYDYTVTGGLSGPAVKPVAVRMVWQTAKAVNIPIVGLGGIRTGDDALEFIMAGATAVQVGTANFLDPATTMRVIDRLNEYCVRHNVSNINSLRGII